LASPVLWYLTFHYHAKKGPPQLPVLSQGIQTLKNISKDQFESKVSWSKVVAVKHKKYNQKGQKATDKFPVTSNRYNLLRNDSNDDDFPLGMERLSDKFQIYKEG
jgi:hypothetical protein